MPRKAARREIFQGDGPTPEQLAKGDIERRFVTHAESATKSMAHISSHSPVERWSKAGRLSDSQMAAIALVRRLWQLTGLKQKTTTRWAQPVHVAMGADNEWIENMRIDARKDLARIEGYCVPWQFEVFENVCRFDEAAGVAGSSLGFNGTKAAQAATLMLVRCVADQIAKEERL